MFHYLKNMGKFTLMVGLFPIDRPCIISSIIILIFQLTSICSGTFGSLCFSPDEKHLMYLAEKKDPKKQSFLKFGVASTSDETQVVDY